MKKVNFNLAIILMIFCCICFTSCGHKHIWTDATCTEPKTCSVCKETEGKANGHKWVDATCTEPKTCSVCKETEGKANGHKWVDATCTEPKTCSICDDTKGDILGHKWIDATYDNPKRCERCDKTEGEKLEVKHLDTPVISVEILENHQGGIVSWDSIPYADYYKVSYIWWSSDMTESYNEEEIIYTNVWESGFSQMDYDIKHCAVKACKETKNGEICSNWSNELNFKNY